MAASEGWRRSVADRPTWTKPADKILTKLNRQSTSATDAEVWFGAVRTSGMTARMTGAGSH
jgi:hypothetical protein